MDVRWIARAVARAMRRRAPAVAAAVLLATLVAPRVPAAPARAADATVAVSLRRVQAALAAGARSPERDAALHLGGLTRVDGWVVDEASGDVVLFGVAEPGAPPLWTEDFAVALRNAWRIYARVENGTRYFEPPGCSIDPSAQTLVELQKAAQRMGGARSTEETERAISSWEKSCERPQAVRVVGMPFDCRLAKAVVAADYSMKRLANGVDSVEVPGFASLTRLALDRARADGSAELSPMDRFWFESGGCAYEAADGIARITRSEVVLRTEEEHVSKRGQARGTGGANPLAERFAGAFTAHYDAIARERAEFAELAALFRLVGVGRALQAEGVEAPLDGLLHDVALPSVSHPRQLAGLAHVERVVSRTKTDRGFHEQRLWLPSCGGVSMAVEPARESKDAGRTKALETLRAALLASRPAADSLRWSVRGR